MDEHQGRKSEMDAREEKIASVLATGEQMIQKDHFASNEVRSSIIPVVVFHSDWFGGSNY